MATAESVLTKAPYFLQVATGASLYYSAENFRDFNRSVHRAVGVLGHDDFQIAEATDVGWKIRVLPGYANIVNVNFELLGNHLGGVYTAYLPQAINEIDIPWRPPGTGSRTHKVFLAVYDPLIAGNATVAKIVISEDEGSGAPIPVGAAGYLQLATVTMTAGQLNIQNTNIKNATAHGGSVGPFVDMGAYLANGYVSVGGIPAPNNFRARYTNGAIRLSGAINKSNGAAFPSTGDLTIGTLPTGMVPITNRYLTGVCAKNASGASGTMTWQCVAAANGNLIARVPTTNAPLALVFDGMTYELD